MKSRILLACAFVALCFSLSAQPLNWTESLYNPLKTSTITREATVKSEGSSSLKYVFTDDGTPYFICDTFKVTGGATFNFSVDYMDNDPAGIISTRIWFFTAPKTAYLSRLTSGNTVDSPNWQAITQTGTVPATATLAYVAIRMNVANAATFTSATFYADNMKYTEGSSTTNAIKNGGFENWFIAPGSTLLNWTESLYDLTKTSVIVNDTKAVKDGANSLKYTFTDPGTPYLICDTFKVTGGATFNFSADYLENDPAGVLSTRIWFFTAPKTAYLTRLTSGNTTDSPTWQTITQTGTVPATATLAYVALRMNVTSAATFTSATFNVDNVKYTEGTSTSNLVKNGSFEDWKAPSSGPEFLSFKFAGLTPNVVGLVNKTAYAVSVEVPYSTNVSALVPTFTTTDGTTAKVGTTAQVSGTTANNFTNVVTYTLTKGTTTQDWKVTVTKPAPTTGNDILSFKFAALTPIVEGTVTASSKTVTLEVPTGTNLSALVPTVTLSDNATVSPLSGVAQNFTAPKTYTVTAQDGTTQTWTVTVTTAPAGQTTLFFENFESLKTIPSTWVIVNNDKYLQAVGEERWQDSAWVVSTSTRTELKGTKVAMASSYTSNMPLTGRADDWMILPAITIGSNSTLSWQAMSITSSGNYPDDYKVYIAPFTSGVIPSVSYFEENGNLLLSVAPENWSAGVGNPGAGIASRSVNLKTNTTPDAPNGWFDRKVWIAFVLTTDQYTNPKTGVPNSSAGGSNLAIDNIKVVNNINTGLDETSLNDFDTKIYPNPASNEIQLSFNSSVTTMAYVSIIDMIGREVRLVNKEVVSGMNNLKVDVSDLRQGVYMVKTSVNGKVSRTKLILKK